MIGKILGGRYEIREKIGSGGMADVYKAYCIKLNRFVALKVLKDRYNVDREFVSRFEALQARLGLGAVHLWPHHPDPSADHAAVLPPD